jgi:hypothetical protein
MSMDPDEQDVEQEESDEYDEFEVSHLYLICSFVNFPNQGRGRRRGV